MVRMQVLLRDGVAATRPEDRNAAGHGRPDPRTVAMAWALVEAEPARFVGEDCHDIHFPRRGRDRGISISGSPSPLNDSHPRERPHADAEVTFSATRIEVRADALAGLTTFGRLHLRRTRFPGPPARETLVACGIVANPGDLPRATLMTFEGEGTLAMTASRAVPEAVMEGMGATFPFQQPVWGFGTEPRAFVSTLHPDLVRLCARHAALENEADRTAAEEGEFARLSKDPGVRSVRGAGDTDAEYQAWRAFVRESGTWRAVSPNFDEYPTAAELGSRQANHAALFREWHGSRDPYGPRFG